VSLSTPTWTSSKTASSPLLLRGGGSFYWSSFPPSWRRGPWFRLRLVFDPAVTLSPPPLIFYKFLPFSRPPPPFNSCVLMDRLFPASRGRPWHLYRLCVLALARKSFKPHCFLLLLFSTPFPDRPFTLQQFFLLISHSHRCISSTRSVQQMPTKWYR